VKRAFFLVLVVACGYRGKEQVLTAADLRVPERTKITNYMDAPIRQFQPSEKPPEQVSRASLLDEARIAKLGDDEICFDVVVRTQVDLDTALSEMRLLVNGKPARLGEDERVSVHDHTYGGERDVLVANAVTKDAFANLRLTEPTENVFRVIERRGRVCRTGAFAAAKEITLEVIIVMDDNRGNWGEKFVWRVE
jgi:hypothetical protein